MPTLPNLSKHRWLAIPALAIIVALALVTITAPATAQSPRPAVTGLVVQPSQNPGELDVSWDAHPDGAEDYTTARTG